MGWHLPRDRKKAPTVELAAESPEKILDECSCFVLLYHLSKIDVVTVINSAFPVFTSIRTSATGRALNLLVKNLL